MKTLQLGSIGISLNVSDNNAHLETAAELEALGYATIWVPGGQLDRLDRISQILRATEHIPVASGIIAPDRYSSQEVATLYATVERDHPGRFVVGLGAPQRPRAMAALGEYLDRLDAAEPPVPADHRILAAIGPRKLALARDRFAGAVPLMVTPEYTAGARRVLGLEPVLVVSQFVVLDSDPQRARDTARSTLRFLLGIRGYSDAMLRMGFDDDDVRQLSDRLVDGVVAWGDADAVTTRVAAQLAAGADQVVLNVLNEGDQPNLIEVAGALAPILLS